MSVEKSLDNLISYIMKELIEQKYMSVEKSLSNLISIVKELIEQKNRLLSKEEKMELTNLIFAKQKQEFLECLLDIRETANTLTGEKKQMFLDGSINILNKVHFAYFKKIIMIEKMEEIANTLKGKTLFIDGIEVILNQHDNEI